jgi:hypothetical protein
MNKIGIVSYYRNINFGSAFQACAMQMAIRKLGYECEHIKFFFGRSRGQRLLALMKNPFPFLKNKLGRYYKKVVFPEYFMRRDKFAQFVTENIKESEKIYTSENIAHSNTIYDAFVCGSDQIWAPNQFNEWFYINFISESSKKIAYAPSIGLPVIPDHLKDKMATLIGNIGHLSIREREGATIIRELTGLEVPVVLDPTLLISKEEWLAKVVNRKAPKEPYILCLFLGENPEHREVVDAYKMTRGYKNVVIPFRKGDYTWGDTIMAEAGPLDFLDLVNNASMVFTDSFHGAAFALNLNRPFGVFMRFADDHPICQNSRIRNLLDLFALHSRLVRDARSLRGIDSDIDYAVVNEKLVEERAKSLDYLSNALRNSTIRSRRHAPA